jgi:hypothetical protein
MFLQPNISVMRFVTLGIVLLLLHAFIGMSRIAYAQETERQPPETIDDIISETVEPESSESIDEIVVYGDRPLPALRREVYRAEENFFDLFSSLNDDDDYDVRCYYEVPSFTHIRRHVCRANFVIDATSAESAPAFSENVGAFSRPAAYEIRRKKERLRELMETLVAEHPELAQALNKYTDSRQILKSEKEKR